MGVSRAWPWSRTGVLAAVAGVLLSFVEISVDRRASWPVSLSAALLAAFALFAGLARRPPHLRLPPRPRLPAALAKGVFLTVRAAVEEVIWRWFVLGLLVPVLGAGLALAVSAAGFALAHRRHQRARGVAVHLLTGVTFGAVFLATGSLAAAVGAHVAYNLLVLAAVEGEWSVANGGDPAVLPSASQELAPAPEREPLAELVHVDKRFGAVAALTDVSLTVAGGEIVALLGRNGAGKTTALNVLLGLRRPDRGSARLFGIDAREVRARRHVGATPQEPAFPPTLTVAEIVELVAAHYPSPADAPALLARFGLQDVASRQAGGLSTGQRRRLAVALAFAGRPRVAFFDEPTAGLDVASRRSVWQAIAEFAAQGGAALITTHDLGEAEALATRVVVVSGGQVVADGSVADIAARAGMVEVCLPEQTLPALRGVTRVVRERRRVSLYTDDGESVIRQLVLAGASLDGLEVRRLALEQAFLALVESKP